MAELPTALRARSHHLDTLATSLEGSLALDLYRRAGPDTWRGPTAERCEQDLRRVRHLVLAAAAGLRAEARALRSRAVAAELSAAVAIR